MRVLLTTDTVGGVWTFTQELTTGLLRRGHNVALLSFGRHPDSEQQPWVAATAANHPDRFLFHASDAPLEWMEANEETWVRGASAISKFLDDTDFDPHLLHSSQFCFGRFQAGIPVVVTAHSDVLSWAEACRPEGLPDSPWLRRYEHLVREGLQSANAIAAPSGWMATSLQRLYGYGREVFVVANGRSLPSSGAVRPLRELHSITAGRLWDPAKGLATLAEIVPRFRIEIAGDVSLDSRSAALPALGPNCRFLGALAPEALLERFHRAAIYIATSLYEPFGLAPLEAALCGCALVLRDLPSLREIWADAALYFRDAQELQQLLNELAAAPKRLAEAQVRGRTRAARYTAQRMADEYLSLYESCLHNAGWHPQECETTTANPTEPQHAA